MINISVKAGFQMYNLYVVWAIREQSKTINYFPEFYYSLFSKEIQQQLENQIGADHTL